jgi:hypothetical protein
VAAVPAPKAAAAPAPSPAPAPVAAKIPSRSQTLVFGENPPTPNQPAAAAKPAPAPEPAKPHTPVPATPMSMGHPSQPVAAVASAAVNGHLAGKLSELGLSPAQADAVMALSREVVERVVWEVVPQLAEAIIKEEITRLTKA